MTLQQCRKIENKEKGTCRENSKWKEQYVDRQEQNSRVKRQSRLRKNRTKSVKKRTIGRKIKSAREER